MDGANVLGPSSTKLKVIGKPEYDEGMASFEDTVKDQDPEESPEDCLTLSPAPRARHDGQKHSKKGKEPEVEAKHSKKDKQSKRSAWK